MRKKTTKKPQDKEIQLLPISKVPKLRTTPAHLKTIKVPSEVYAIAAAGALKLGFKIGENFVYEILLGIISQVYGDKVARELHFRYEGNGLTWLPFSGTTLTIGLGLEGKTNSVIRHTSPLESRETIFDS